MPLFTQKQHQSTQSGDGAQALYHNKRLKDETDLSSISWALEHKAWQKLFLAFSLLLWAMLASQRLSPNIYDFIQRLKHLPRTTALVSHTCTHRRAHTEQFRLCICKQVRPVWHHSTTAGYGSKNRQWITVDYISTRLDSLRGISTTFLQIVEWAKGRT